MNSDCCFHLIYASFSFKRMVFFRAISRQIPTFSFNYPFLKISFLLWSSTSRNLSLAR